MSVIVSFSRIHDSKSISIKFENSHYRKKIYDIPCVEDILVLWIFQWRDLNVKGVIEKFDLAI